MTKKWTALLLAAVLAVGLSACDTSRAEAPSSNLESGVSAIEDAMTKRNETESSSFPAGSDLRIALLPTPLQRRMISRQHTTTALEKLRIIPVPPCRKRCRNQWTMRPC